MKKVFYGLLIAAVLFTLGCSKEEESSMGPVSLTLWTKEGEADGSFQFVQALVDEFVTINENVDAVEVLNKEVESLREDFQTASLAGTPPDLLWTVSDHAGPFITAQLIQPVDTFVDVNAYVESVMIEGKTWAVPISSGNHLMLLYNKDYISTPPANTDELIEMAKAHTSSGMYGLVWNLGEAFWLIPWLGGFDGRVFDSDGVTPTLDTSAMVDTLAFMSSLREDHGVTPMEADYNGADTLFKEGKAAMIINGDWSLGEYKSLLGEKFGVAPLPMVSSTSKWPAPYTSGTYFMIPSDLASEKEQAVGDLIKFVTSSEVQGRIVRDLSRLPGLRAALEDPAIQNDPVLKGSAAQLANGTPMPTVLEMRAVWDAIGPELKQVMAGAKAPAEAAAEMQKAAEAGITAQQ